MVADLVAVIGGGIGVVVWLVRLEGRISHNTKVIDMHERQLEAVNIKHAELDSRAVAKLTEISERLARIEGRLLTKEGE